MLDRHQNRLPLTEQEVVNMGIEERQVVDIDVAVGDTIRVVSGPFDTFEGVVEEIHPEKQSLKVLISMFGRETPVELEFSQVQKL